MIRRPALRLVAPDAPPLIVPRYPSRLAQVIKDAETIGIVRLADGRPAYERRKG
jgi:hypothetical protein